jgi:DNA repair exonuclease SbcCD nuclease subunit
MINIFATGDNHLGKALKMRKSLREMGINNFKKIPEKIKSNSKDIDYVIFAGDVFDNHIMHMHRLYKSWSKSNQ